MDNLNLGEITESEIRNGLRECDIPQIMPFWRQGAELIEGNPFSERLKYLIKRQDLRSIRVKNAMGEMKTPNCIGTALFIAGVGKFDYPYHGYDFELNEHMRQPGNDSEGALDRVMRLMPHIERRIPGALIFSYSAENDGWHAGIYLGQINEEHVSFAQHGNGNKFGLETLSRNYCSPDFYIPRSLMPKTE